MQLKKRLFLLVSMLCIMLSAMSQQLAVSSFKCIPMDMDAKVNYPIKDHNGRLCALIKVENSNTGFAFDTGTLSVVEVEQKVGEIWVYVQQGVQKITIKHQTLGILRDYPFPERIKEGTVYVMKLESGKVHTYVEQAPQGAYLTMRLTPANAIVYIDDKLQTIEDGSLMLFLSNGKHSYRVQAAGYEQEVGIVEITGERKDMQVVLKSNKASVTLSCADTKATLYVDGRQVGIGTWQGELTAGAHILEATRDGYRSQSQQIEVAEKEVYEHRFGELTAISGFLEVVSRPIDTEVWLDGNKIGTTPYGPANALVGSHKLELRKAGYTTFKKDIVISEGETCLVNNALEKATADIQGSNVSAATGGGSVAAGGIQEFTVNGVTFKMVAVKGGTFQMGSNDSEADDDEKPVHSVTLSDYYIGQTEVTQALWRAVMGKNPSKWKGDNLPVERVSWKDCQEFISILNALTGKTFRLPTEAEWEFAARGGNKSKGYKYSGSDYLDDVAWYGDNSGDKTHPVATKQANELGIYDMSGNVWEWCSDRYDKKYYKSSPQTNPRGADSGSSRVYRGGGWGNSARYCRVSSRSLANPGGSGDDLGLRLVLVP